MASATATPKLLTHQGKVAVVSGLILSRRPWVNRTLGPCGQHEELSPTARVSFVEPLACLVEHDTRQVVAWLHDGLELSWHNNGLHAAVALPDNALGHEILEGMQRHEWEQATYPGDYRAFLPGAIRGWSACQWARRAEKRIVEMELYEVSLVAHPARIGAGLGLSLSWRPAESWSAEPLLEKVSHVGT